jgi:hypothetical protein
MKRISILMLMPIFAASCGPTPQEIYQDNLQRASYFCTSYGFENGTSEFSNCVQQEINKANQLRSERNMALMQMGGAGVACSQYGGLAGMGAMTSGQCTPPPQSENVYTRCDPDGSGGYNCYSN